jgi:hypothetical protein
MGAWNHIIPGVVACRVLVSLADRRAYTLDVEDCDIGDYCLIFLTYCKLYILVICYDRIVTTNTGTLIHPPETAILISIS